MFYKLYTKQSSKNNMYENNETEWKLKKNTDRVHDWVAKAKRFIIYKL